MEAIVHWTEQRVLPAVAAAVPGQLLLAPDAESAVWCGPAPNATAAADSARPIQSTHHTRPASRHTTHGQPVDTPHTPSRERQIVEQMKQLMFVYLQFGLFCMCFEQLILQAFYQ